MYQFPGLVSGDRWCLCATRWKEALERSKDWAQEAVESPLA